MNTIIYSECAFSFIYFSHKYDLIFFSISAFNIYANTAADQPHNQTPFRYSECSDP